MVSPELPAHNMDRNRSRASAFVPRQPRDR